MNYLVVACLALLSTQALAETTVAVDQKNRAFTVHDIDIDAGDMLRFNNDDEFGHQVFTQSPAFSFDTDETDPGQHADVRFPVRGHYQVLCHIHPRMRLDVNVR